MLRVEFPYFLPDGGKILEKFSRFPVVINAGQRTKWAICVHADPFLLGHVTFLNENFTMAFQFPPVKAGERSDCPGHEFRQQEQPENFSQEHNLEVVVDGTPVI